MFIKTAFKVLAGVGIFISLFLIGCDTITGLRVDSAQIRVLNNSDFDFQNLEVNSVSFGSLEKYRFSEYHEFDVAYHYGAVRFEVNGKEFAWLPIDYVGETPLPDGRYTYVVSIDFETGATALNFFKSDEISEGKQTPGRKRMISIERHFEVTAAQQTNDHGYIISGSKTTITNINPTVSTVPGSKVIYLPEALVRHGDSRAILVKTDATGNKQWLQTYGESGEGSKIAKAMALSPDGGYIFTGHDEFLAKKPDGAALWWMNAWLVKVDALGNQLWSKHFGDFAFTQANWLQSTADGAFILAGKRDNATLLFKVDATGDELWRTLFPNDDQAEFVFETKDGGYLLGGDAYGYFSDNSWIIKTDALGNELWTHPFEGSALAGVESSEGGYVVVGNTRNSPGASYDGLMLKVDANGNKLWERKLGGIGKDWLRAVTPANDSGFVLAGYTGSFNANSYDFWLIKTDANGQQIWQQLFDKADAMIPDDKAKTVLHTGDGGYLLAGTTGAHKIWLIKINAAGMKEWDKTIDH